METKDSKILERRIKDLNKLAVAKEGHKFRFPIYDYVKQSPFQTKCRKEFKNYLNEHSEIKIGMYEYNDYGDAGSICVVYTEYGPIMRFCLKDGIIFQGMIKDEKSGTLRYARIKEIDLGCEIPRHLHWCKYNGILGDDRGVFQEISTDFEPTRTKRNEIYVQLEGVFKTAYDKAQLCTPSRLDARRAMGE